MSQFIQNNRKLYQSVLSAIALTTIITYGFSSTVANSAPTIKQLATQKQADLREGQVVITGTQGQYTGKILVRATPAIVWAVLTDYDNYEKFLPDVAESKLLESNGNKKVFEQVKIIQAAIFSRKSLIRLAVTETYPQKIAFSMTSGELKSLEGSWTIKPLSPVSDTKPTQILIMHQVSVDPGAKPWRNIFYGIYEDSLEETLQAINTEIERRSQTPQ